MEAIEMIQLVGYTTCILGCSVLCVIFLQEVLTKRLRASFWWVAGFFSYACALVILMVTVFDGFHRILVILAFAIISASVTFLYYAASLCLLQRESFFTDKFAVIIFVISGILFVLPLYFSSEEYMSRIIGSSTMVLFAVVFFIIAVLFSQVARKHTDSSCKNLVILHSLGWWIVATWSLYIALFWGLLVTCGLVFVLSSFEFVLLLYCYKGGDDMIEKDNERLEFYTQMVYGVEDKVLREADSAKVRLNDIMHKIGDTLLFMRVEEEKTYTEERISTLASRQGVVEKNQVDIIVDLVQTILRNEYLERKEMEWCAHEKEITDENLMNCGINVAEDILTQADIIKKKMVTRASQLGIEKENIIKRVAELVKANLGLVRKVYSGSFPSIADGGNCEPCQIDEIPYGGVGVQALKSLASTGDHEMRVLALLARTSSSADRDMILNCCGLVVGMCTLENEAVTEYEWNKLEKPAHPGGMIGHTYNVLRDIDEKVSKGYAQLFKGIFQDEANRFFNEAERLRTGALDLINDLPKNPTPSSEQQAQKAAIYLKETVDLLKKASELLSCASKFVNDPEGYATQRISE